MNKEVLERWETLKIKEGIFRFSCGGDSMSDTEIVFQDENNNEFEDAELSSYFEDEVYRNVTFYEASDGHYMGESGNVYITLCDDGDAFDYMKSAQSEWSEFSNGEMLCEVNEDEVKFLTEYIDTMSDADWNGMVTIYKKDFILKPEHEKMIVDLHEKFADCANCYEPEDVVGEMSDEPTQYSTAENEGTIGIEFVEKEGKTHVKLYVQCNVYTYTDS